MNLNEEQKAWVSWAIKAIIVVALVAVMGAVGVDIPIELPIPDPPIVEVAAPNVDVAAPEVHVDIPAPEEAEPAETIYSYQTDNYAEQGGSTWVVGGNMNVVSGGTLSVASGATASFAGATLTSGNMTINGARDAATGYDYFLTVDGSATGVVNGAKTYGIYVSMDRPAGYESGGGDLDDAGLKIRVETEAITTTAGTVLRGADVEAKADNPSGTVTNLYGGLFTAKSDTGAGDVETMVALSANTQNNAAVNTYLAAADVRLMRQAATEPTEEYVMECRNSSTSGSGADAAIFVNSDYVGSATTDSFDYGIDFASAAINTADVRFENGTTLSENTDTVLTFSEFIGGAEQTAEVVSAGSTIVATGSFQPISSASAVTCDTTTCIQNGTQDGQLLILQNVNASDTITIDGTGGNVECKADVVLGSYDTLTLVWNGSDWYCLFYYDNS